MIDKNGEPLNVGDWINAPDYNFTVKIGIVVETREEDIKRQLIKFKLRNNNYGFFLRNRAYVEKIPATEALLMLLEDNS